MPETSNSNNFFIADLEHFGESLWRNEEIGEKRFNFFLTLFTAVIAGLVALYTKAEDKLDFCIFINIVNGAFVGLLVLGLLTYLRMLHRNRVTDQYQRTLKHIREKLLTSNPLEEYKVPQPLGAGKWMWVRGGLAETVGAMNAVLLCALLIINSVNFIWAVTISLFVLFIFWVCAAHRKGVY